LEGGKGKGNRLVSHTTLEAMVREMPTNRVVRDILAKLELGELEKAAKRFEWNDQITDSEQ